MGGVPLPSSFPWSAMGVGVRGKPRRGMLRRAVFSDFQRKGLEDRFQLQKYISKPDRKKLAEKLGLKDSQVGYGVCYVGVVGYIGWVGGYVWVYTVGYE